MKPTWRSEFDRAERFLARAVAAEAEVARLRAKYEPLVEGDFLPGLPDALHQARTGKDRPARGETCTLCVIIRHTKPGGPREHLEAQVNGTMSGAALQRALHTLGLSMTRETIRNHRNEGHTP